MNAFANTPPVTKALLFLNGIAYLLVNLLAPMSGGEAAFVTVLETFGLRPAAFWAGAFWQPLTAIFLHGSFFHIFFNMLGVWSIGSFLERSLGSNRYLWLYMVAGLAGSLLILLVQAGSTQITVGASGALLGLLGAIAVLAPNSRLLFFVFPVKARTAAILIGVASIVFELFGGLSFISHLGHLGGLIGGYLYTRFALSPDQAHERMYAGRTRPDAGASPFMGGGGGPFGGGGGGPSRGPRTSRDEMILRMMQEMLHRSQNATGRPYSSSSHVGQPPGEKVINPRPEDGPQSGRSQSASGNEQRRMVYFDPMTGRFYVRES